MSDHTLGEHGSRLVIEGMTPAAPSPMFIEIHNVNGEVVKTYAIDARQAVERFPDTWSFEPWPAKRRKS